MTPETSLTSTPSPVEQPAANGPAVNEAAPLPEPAASSAPPVISAQPAPPSRRLFRLMTAGVVLVGGGVVLALALRAGGTGSLLSGSEPAPGDARAVEDPSAIPVNTVFPRKKTLVRTLDQPGSIEPYAQVELYAKASGYLKMVAHDLTPERAAGLIARPLVGLAAAPGLPAAAGPAELAAATELALEQSPEKDHGSFVTAGELLLVIDAPELEQDISQKEAIWKQRVAELEAARTALTTFQAALQAAEAQKNQAEADVHRAAADHAYYSKQLARLQELVRRQTIAPEVADEKVHQVEAALAAWESSKAKLQAAQAELAVIASKLATAKSDLRVKEAQVHVAIEDLHRAEILAGYAAIHAPCNGVITHRDVDEGDFISNASSGQSRRLMTIAAIDRVKVVLQVPEREAVWVEPGAEAVIHVDARSGWQIKGRVSRIAHALDNQSRTMRVEIDLPNPDRKLKPGMYGQVSLTLQAIEGAWVIPATAVFSRGGENYVIQVENGIARRQRVHLLYDDGHEVAVAKVIRDREVPLDGSEELVVSNKGELRDGQRVRATPLAGP
ncbi:MAG TPA: efflux RND transporter periplasmic adaptor subunit [Gemmataceae bacterium]|nr:efflux RND transporter periplasmic adaptor subunit [Gemmataceae bacterium]